jgi:hypothetical protein
MNPFLLNKGIDLVDFEDVKLFMFKNDNLYNIVIAESRKNQSVIEYQKFIRENDYLHSLVTPENVDQISKARFGIHLFLHHLWQHDINFDLLLKMRQF